MSIANLYPQIRPSLNLDFANSDRLDPRVTFTRASTATYFDSAGVLTSAAINAPRLDYNPSTLAAQGLLIEEQRTNSLPRSAEFDNASWVKTRATVTANTSTAPDGTTSADSIVEDGTAANTHDLRQGGVVNSATTNWALSFFLKAVNRTWALIELQNATATSNRARAWFNLQTGVVGTGNAAGSGITYVSHSIQNVGNGWYRCVVVGTVDVSVTSIQAWVEGTIADNTSNYDGVNGQTSIYVWGAQLEAGAFATSYIPTVASQVTRAVDSVFLNTLSPWFNQREGTLYVSASYYSAVPAAGTRGGFVGSGSYAAANAINIFNGGGTATVDAFFTSVTYPDVNLNRPIATAAYAINKIAYGYNQNNGSYNLSVNASAVATGTSTQNTATFTSIALGRRDSSTSNLLNGYIQRFSYYPRRLTNAELQSVTT